MTEVEKSSFAKKVIKASGENNILNSISKEKLLEFVKNNPHYSIKVNTENKLILNTKKAIQNFIKILNEEILISKLTNTEYEVHSKNKFTE